MTVEWEDERRCQIAEVLFFIIVVAGLAFCAWKIVA